jgi:hypothetical protein
MVKSSLVEAWSAPKVSRKLSFPDFMTTAQDGGKVVSRTHRPSLPPGNTPGPHFFPRNMVAFGDKHDKSYLQDISQIEKSYIG